MPFSAGRWIILFKSALLPLSTGKDLHERSDPLAIETNSFIPTFAVAIISDFNPTNEN